jgi:hypothetical protein
MENIKYEPHLLMTLKRQKLKDLISSSTLYRGIENKV